MAKLQCLPCGYIYDESNGDPKHHVKPGTKFSALPGTWVCPVCGASTDEFEQLAG